MTTKYASPASAGFIRICKPRSSMFHRVKHCRSDRRVNFAYGGIRGGGVNGAIPAPPPTRFVRKGGSIPAVLRRGPKPGKSNQSGRTKRQAFAAGEKIICARA